jgi:hypothetical protein
MLHELTSDPQVRIVGPKIVFPDGTLQEAGCIIRQDCSTEMAGIGQDPDDKAFNFKRHVDYISGACWFFEKTFFQRLGGFDESLAPAYAEDLDFCARVRRDGGKILYLPDAMIMHHLSVSSNLLSSEFKYYQSAVNKKKFIEKYQTFYKYESKIKPVLLSPLRGQNPEAFTLQARQAKRYGIQGLCFPVGDSPEDFARSKEGLENFCRSNAEIGYCLCLSGETTTNGKSSEHPELAFRELLEKTTPFLLDRRYMKIDGKPLLIIRRSLPPETMQEILASWRDYWRRREGGELYLCLSERNFQETTPLMKPERWGFDAVAELPAFPWFNGSGNETQIPLMDYPDVVEKICQREHPGYKRFPGCFYPSDNPERGEKRFLHPHPTAFQVFLERKAEEALLLSGDERMLFIGASNPDDEMDLLLESENNFAQSWLSAIEKMAKEN